MDYNPNLIKRDEKGRLVPGTCGGPGRPKGKTMKEFAREWLLNMTDEQKAEWLSKLSPEILWKMAEGMPRQEMEVDANVQYVPISETSNDLPSTSVADGSPQGPEPVQSDSVRET